MSKADFDKSIKVEEKDLIPRDPYQKCLWTMTVAAKSEDFGALMPRDPKVQSYISYNYTLNAYLGYLEYDYRENKIGKEDFKKGCESVYENHDVDFDVLRDNLKQLNESDANRNELKEFMDANYYKLSSNPDLAATHQELQNKVTNFDSNLSDKLAKQAEKHLQNVQNKQQHKEDKQISSETEKE